MQLASGCNLVKLQKYYIERGVRSRGLTQKRVELGPDQINYWEGGSGPDLVLLHGFGADGTVGWSPQIAALAQRFHVIVPDLLWFGDSRSEDKNYSVEHQVSAVRNLLNHLGVKKCDIMGISYGGIVAMVLLSESPDLVQRAIFVASPGPVYTEQDYSDLLKRFNVKFPAEIIIPTTSEGLKRLLKIAYKNPPWVPFFVQKDLIDYVKDSPEGQRTALLDDLVSNFTRLRQKLQIHPKHVLIVWGSDDPVFPLDIGKRLKTYFGDEAQLKIIKEARHAPNIEFDAEFNQIILDFLK